MRAFASPTIDTLYRRLEQEGRDVSPRGAHTKELLACAATWPMGRVPLRAGMSRRLAATEAWMLVVGTFDADLIRRAAPSAKLHLFTKMAQYGPMVKNQVGAATRLLKQDPSSRQAVLYLGCRGLRPEDRPCTNSIQLLVRGGTLHALVSMRSWDLVYGVPNDLVMFSGLGLAVAKVLRVLPGTTTVFAGSLHVYLSTAHLAQAADPPWGAVTINFERESYDSWEQLVAEARAHGDEPWRWLLVEAHDDKGDEG